jgi:hypothetical protein
MSPELFISQPPVNTVPPHERRYLLGSAIHEIVAEQLDLAHASPATHPKVLELFAGDAPLSYWLSRRGWSNFTCIDMAMSPTSLAPDNTTWIYANLQELITRLTNKENVGDFAAMANTFDIVTSTFAIQKRYFFPKRDRDILGKFFVREGGFIYSH